MEEPLLDEVPRIQREKQKNENETKKNKEKKRNAR